MPDDTLAARSRHHIIEAQDIKNLIFLPAMFLLACALPERHWHRACRLISIRAVRGSAERRQLISDVIDITPEKANRILFQQVVNRNLAVMQCLGHYRPGSWKPKIRIENAAIVGAQTKRGRGVILWAQPLVFGDIVTKMACHEAGLRISHVSRDSHGFSNTRFGETFLNPIWTGVESRYIEHRFILGSSNEKAAVRNLIQLLRGNGLVSITTFPGPRWLEVPFFAGRIRLSSGPPWMALKTNSVIVPVFTVRNGGEFICRFESPLPLDFKQNKESSVKGALAAYARLLEGYVLQWPDQFRWAGVCA